MTTFVDEERAAPPAEQASLSGVTPDVRRDSEVAGQVPGRSGTYCSFLLTVIGVVASIIVFSEAGKNINMSNFDDGCPSDFLDSCKKVTAVLRISCAMTIVFGVQALGTLLYSRFYDSLWILKFIGFIVLVIGLFFASSEAFGTQGYAWFARITGFLYLILQQVILLDLAYTWNEKWVALATDNEEEVKGKGWLVCLLVVSAVLFAGSFVVIGILYWQFKDCSENIAIITLTLGLCLLATILQLFFSDEGSVLTSAIMTAYCTYICYSAVILQPSASCNPTLNSSYQTLSAIIGLVLTTISVMWTTYNTVNKIPQITDRTTGESINLKQVASSAGGSAVVKSLSHREANELYDLPVLKYLLAQVAVVFLLVAGYYAMMLTNWATYQSATSIYEPRTGRSSMWIQAAGQWIAITFYLWSLIAPKVLTNREFN